MYEVEQKYHLADRAPVEDWLLRHGATFHVACNHMDRYFAHPCRDFAVTDEALRLRRAGDEIAITWKGPRLSTASKTRREIELALACPGGRPSVEPTLDQWTELLESLGFRRVRDVAKHRQPAVIRWEEMTIEVVIDHVDGLGEFLELEVLADEEGVAAAQSRIASLAMAMGCGAPERRSYLEMVLDDA